MRNLIMLLAVIAITTSGALSRDVKVKSYTKKDGTKVEGYTKTVKDKETVEVAGYTKKDGTKVAGYTRKKAK